jgi:hypothetical protein
MISLIKDRELRVNMYRKTVMILISLVGIWNDLDAYIYYATSNIHDHLLLRTREEETGYSRFNLKAGKETRLC